MNRLIPFLLMLPLFSCQPRKSEILYSQSDDKELKIQVWGEQVFFFEPWKVFVATDYDLEKDTISTELHTDAIDTRSVEFSWEGNRTCVVYLKHQDGEISEVPIRYRQ
jgi:hypothetical protein